MGRLRLGPLLRYVDEDTATIWIETDGPCEAEVRCAPGSAGGSARTWQIAGHHYALITVVGLEPGTETAYRIALDGTEVWPLPGSALPPSTIHTPAPGTGSVDVAFGSCRWAARPSASSHDPVGPDALDALAQRAIAGGERPDVLLLLGDQVYADETSEAVREKLAARRDLSQPPWNQVADFDEYTLLYDESWTDPEVRWLLSTVPSLMIFDDHDVIDDWNTSESWRSEMRATSWWRERILGGLASYWVYQHLGNLSPGELAEDSVFAAVRETDDGTAALREFVERADANPDVARWSYRRDLGRVRMLIVDTRAARVLDEQQRAMLGKQEMAWLREQMLTGTGPEAPAPPHRPPQPHHPDDEHGPGGGAASTPGTGADTGADTGTPGFDHLLLGTSLPWLLPPAIHDAEMWNAALCRGVRGERWARVGERMRRAADLEHWAAYPQSFEALSELVEEVAGAHGAPSTVCVLSGDVHHAYISEPRFPRPVNSRVVQLTCSPMHNSIPAVMRAGFRFGWSRAGRALGRALARHGRTGRPAVKWKRSGGPWFGNQLMTLRLRGRSAELLLEQARPVPEGTEGPGGVRDSGPAPLPGVEPGLTPRPEPGSRSRLERVLRRTLVGTQSASAPAPEGPPHSGS
ncbi:alkaline phosphatase D family protein [Streptomyces marispadix]|uniref:Alkaline phosphatase family protein n=1 Tax=Streptomyces marispadix TaxID=2922868 RepID=A0ABS9SUX7_9ACTN|nr:alkaline phosphatase D family protein [Streptomyces marispadix]MCH6160085.1 alkaline phosphatase family protein [Streptomyces marispadix]